MKLTVLFTTLLGMGALTNSASIYAHNDNHPVQKYAASHIHAPTPVPDRVALTWSDNPATTQSVTWRTDTSVTAAYIEYAVANANGRALQPVRGEAITTAFTSDLNTAHYHSATLTNLRPETLYAYRVGDGANWSEYFHFKTASIEAKPFSFIYFGDAQNELKTHWSRVFREAFRDAPRAAFTLHAGDLINEDAFDAEWGEWHGAPGWVNGTIPIIASPGNHEYYRAQQGPWEQRLWTNAAGKPIKLDVRLTTTEEQGKSLEIYAVKDIAGHQASLTIDDDKIVQITGAIEAISGFTTEQLLNTEIDRSPLHDRRQDEGIPMVSDHWRPQFTFPVQNVPAGLEETTYYIDYQGVRIISLDSNKQREEQVPWLRQVLASNPNSWTIITFHHPIYSPAKDRDNAHLRELWKPVFDEFKVDLVLNGHDHTYARTGEMDTPVDTQNVPTGYQQAYDPAIGTVYVVSVSGPKMYAITKGQFAKRTAQDTQLYQIIQVDGDSLQYKAYTATGELYDAFDLQKHADKPNILIETLD